MTIGDTDADLQIVKSKYVASMATLAPKAHALLFYLRAADLVYKTEVLKLFFNANQQK